MSSNSSVLVNLIHGSLHSHNPSLSGPENPLKTKPNMACLGIETYSMVNPLTELVSISLISQLESQWSFQPINTVIN